MSAVGNLKFGQVSVGESDPESGRGPIRVGQVVGDIDPVALFDKIAEVQMAVAKPTEDRIEVNKQKLDAITALKDKVKEFYLQNAKLRSSLDITGNGDGAFEQFSVSGTMNSANPVNNYLTVSLDSDVTAGQMKINVVKLASYDVKNATEITASENDLIANTHPTGTITIKATDFVVDGTTTWAQLRDLINSQRDVCDAEANIITTDTGKFIFSLKSTALADPISLAETNSILTNMGISTVTTNVNTLKAEFTYQQANEAATTIYSTSNSLTTLKRGVTVNLKSATAGETITLDIRADVAGVIDTIKQWTDAYNNIRDEILLNTDLKIDPKTGDITYLADSKLHGDNEVAELGRDLSQLINATISGLGSNIYQSLMDIGITTSNSADTSRDFKFSVNEEVLQAAIESDFNGVKSLFGENFTTTDNRFSIMKIDEAVNPAIAGQNITVTFSRVGAVYTATLDVGAGTYNESFAVTDNGLIKGPVGSVFEGIYFGVESALTDPGSLTATMTVTSGIAAMGHDTLYDMLLEHTNENEQTSFFEVYAKRIQRNIDSDKDKVESMKERTNQQQKLLQGKLGQLYKAFDAAQNVQSMLKALNKASKGD